jgi:hypothetical protein
LDDLAKLLKLRIVSEKVEISKATSCGICTSASEDIAKTTTSSRISTSRRSTTTISLGCSVEEINWFLATFASGRCWSW